MIQPPLPCSGSLMEVVSGQREPRSTEPSPWGSIVLPGVGLPPPKKPPHQHLPCARSHIFPVEPPSLPLLVALLCSPPSFLLSICSLCWWGWFFWSLWGFFRSLWAFWSLLSLLFPSHRKETVVEMGMSCLPSKPPLCHPKCCWVLVVPRKGGYMWWV